MPTGAAIGAPGPRSGSPVPVGAPSLGGCDFLEDPTLDARSAQPVWHSDPDPLAALVPAIVDEASPFSLWALPGRKSLVHDGRRLLMQTTLGRRMLRVAVSLSLGEGMPFAYAAPAGHRGARTLKAVTSLDATLSGIPASPRQPPITRSDMVHMRALQALDAERDGRSEHEIAEMVFGDVDEQESWNDSATRAKVRYLLDHGRVYRDGGYRDLLYPKPPKLKAVKP